MKQSLEDKITALCNGKYNYPEYRIEQALDILPALKKAVGGKNGKVYAQVNKVSQSGMSRTVSLFIVRKGEIVNLNNTVYRHVYGDDHKDNNQGSDPVRVNGCGMDMLFECTYRLYNFLFSRSRAYQKHLNRYEQL
jgi:hypothetical protein